MEQLHSVTVCGALGADSVTAPQWQAASIILVLRTVHRGTSQGLSSALSRNARA